MVKDMKKLYITLALAFIGTFSYGSDGDTLTKKYTKVKVKQDTALVVTYTITTTDTIKRKDYREQIQRFEKALQSGKESIAIQTKLNEYYLSEIKRLKAEKKKTD